MAGQPQGALGTAPVEYGGIRLERPGFDARPGYMDTEEMLKTLAASQQRCYQRCETAIATWLVARGVTLDKREAKRMWKRTFVKMGADFPWERVMDERWEPYMERHLEWARSNSRW